jgi:tRNA pseudouridine55 synthase
MNGVLIIDKPAGLTSHDVVARVRHILGQKAVGHLGTLDPLATGVLPLVLGNMTRLAQFYLGAEKTYEGVIRFGFATDTYDAEGEMVGEENESSLTLEQVRNLAKKFVGKIQQTPPPFSAKKINGVPAYKLARKKKEVSLAPVEVEVKQFDISKLENSRADFAAQVASGTYLRSMAHEMGQLAGCGAHLESLRRTSVAEFQLADAHTLEELEQAAQRREVNSGELQPGELKNSEARLAEIFVHPRKLLPTLPSVTATEDVAAKIRHGMAVNLADFSRAPEVKVFSGQRDLIAIATRIAGTLFHPRIVLV